jgi:hypothetical protein
MSLDGIAECLGPWSPMGSVFAGFVVGALVVYVLVLVTNWVSR